MRVCVCACMCACLHACVSRHVTADHGCSMLMQGESICSLLPCLTCNGVGAQLVHISDIAEHVMCMRLSMHRCMELFLLCGHEFCMCFCVATDAHIRTHALTQACARIYIGTRSYRRSRTSIRRNHSTDINQGLSIETWSCFWC